MKNVVTENYTNLQKHGSCYFQHFKTNWILQESEFWKHVLGINTYSNLLWKIYYKSNKLREIYHVIFADFFYYNSYLHVKLDKTK